MGQKDVISKEIIKEIGKDISMHILGIDIQGEVTLIDKEWTRIEKRDSDIVFQNQNKIIHIEIQNSNHSKMDLRMLRYYSDILFEYKKCEIKQYLIYIGKENCYMKSEIKRDRISYEYEIIDMKKISCEKLLYHDNPSAVVLSILCDFENKDKQMVVNTILRRLKELTKDDELEYKNYLKKVNILSTNRDLENEVNKGAKMLSVNVRETPFYQMGISDGIKRGIDKGIEKVAVSMLKLNINMELIQKATGLSIENIEKIKKQIQLKLL